MEIRRSYDRLISTMGFPILVRHHLYIESGPRVSVATVLSTHPCVSSCLWVKPNTMQWHLFFISFETLLESISHPASIWNLMQLKGRFHLNFTFTMFNWQLLFETMSLCLLRLYSVWLVAWGIALFKKKNFKYIPRLILSFHPANERRRYQVTPSRIDWEHT